MEWDVQLVKPLSGYRIYVELANGQTGVFALEPYLGRGLMAELRDTAYFNQVDILWGTVTWPHGQDIAPDTLVADMIPASAADLEELASPTTPIPHPA